MPRPIYAYIAGGSRDNDSPALALVLVHSGVVPFLGVWLARSPYTAGLCRAWIDKCDIFIAFPDASEEERARAKQRGLPVANIASHAESGLDAESTIKYEKEAARADMQAIGRAIEIAGAMIERAERN